MSVRRSRPAATLCWSMLAALAAAPAFAGGFAIFGQSARGVGLAGAMTADSDDPSALFYNPASSAFQETSYVAGVMVRANWDLTFDSQPSSGVATQFAQDDPSLLPHAYTVQTLKPYLKLGLAVYQPFDHDATWNNIDTFPGRAISYSSQIGALDLNPSVAVRFNSGLALGIGAVYRTADVTVARRLQTADPLTGQTVDFADFAVDSGQEPGFGFNVGALYRGSDRFSWGFSYRSAIKIDFGGSGLLTQIATGNTDLDDLLALTNPFDEDLAAASTVEFPDVASFGVAVGSAERLRVALDINWTGWSSFEQLSTVITEFPLYSQTIDQQLEDALSYRVGVQWGIASKTVLRFGYAFDETAQPDSAVGPFLYDADRNTLALGFGRDWLDVAVEWVSYSSRPDGSGIGGAFQGETIQASISVKF